MTSRADTCAKVLYERLRLPLVTLPTLHMLFRGYESLEDLITIIWVKAVYRTLRYQVRRFTIFDVWMTNTKFVPSNRLPPNSDNFGLPVREYLYYHGKRFYRNRHSLGVRFASMVSYDGLAHAVIWTDKRKAYSYMFVNGKAILAKILNRQDDPFKTWMRHLGGQALYDAELFNEWNRSPQMLFNDHVVCHYGSHPHITRRARQTRSYHPIWNLIKEVSYKTYDDVEERLEWKEF